MRRQRKEALIVISYAYSIDVYCYNRLMSKATNTNNSKNLMRLGLAIVMLSNPLLYLAIGATIIDIQNIFGASIDRQSISFNTGDPFIQAMSLVCFIGFILIITGSWKRRSTK